MIALDLLPPFDATDAPCVTSGRPDRWFQEAGSPEAIAAYARQLCTGCPVRDACLDYAMTVEGRAGATSRFGVYGGLSSLQRALLARRATRKPRQAVS